MKRLILLALPALACGGCQAENFTSQPLGDVGYAEAFKAAQDVFSQYFSIASSDRDTGRLEARPRPLEQVGQRRLLGASSARQLASMRIVPGREVVADIRVMNQQQDLAAYKQMAPVTADNERPSQTPPAGAAGLTGEQDQAWQDVGRDYALEQTILRDLLGRLHPLAARPPATAPASRP